MVQKYALEELATRTESKNHDKSHQQGRSNGGGDPKQKLKKARSIKLPALERRSHALSNKLSLQREKLIPVKASDHRSPSYMKPTSSSDARKERLQVNFQSSTTKDKKGILSPSKLPSSPVDSRAKLTKTLSRKSSLKLVRPSTKKRSGLSINPNINIQSSTCAEKKNRSPKQMKLLSPPKLPTASPASSRTKHTKSLSKNSSLKPAVRPSMKTSSGLCINPKINIQCSTATEKNRSLKQMKILSPSKLPSFSPVGSGAKLTKTLSRNSSLKPVRPSMKKSSGLSIYPKINVRRATCSSTLKDSKFPKTLDLNLDGTEINTTSVMKVCPYTYCSLNGHMHAPVPPLKSFLTARRRLLETQKSMKLKRLFSISKRRLQKGHKKMESMPLEEVVSDFFVEIYDTSNASKEKTQEANTGEGLNEIPLEDDHRETQKHQSHSVISFEDDGDQKSNLSIKDADLEYVNYDKEVDTEEEKPQCFVEENHVDGKGSNPEGGKNEVRTFFEAISIHCEEAAGTCACLFNGFQINDNNAITWEKAESNAELAFVDEEFSVEGNGSPHSTILSHGFEEQKSENEESKEASFLPRAQIFDSPPGIVKTDQDSKEAEDVEIETATKHSIEPSDDSSCEKKQDKPANNTEEIISMASKEVCIAVNETVQTMTRTNSETDDTIHVAPNIQSPDEERIFGTLVSPSDQPLLEADIRLKAGYNIIRRKKGEDSDETKKFNPRAPRFLPIEMDPEAEKVDLRHQIMEERKAAEEWMIDHALQQAVARLAPARKKKVELLTEAFETVMPFPIWQTPLAHATSNFAHSRKYAGMQLKGFLVIS